MEFETYREYVNKCADNRYDDIIPNSNLDHAKILIATFFSHSENIIRIFSSRLHADIYEYNELVKNVHHFLQNDESRKIEILLQEIDEANMNKLDSHHFIEICKEFPQQCELRRVAEIDKNIATHFVIMDKIGFRFCPDREGTSAFASFNQPKAATNLVNQFKLLFNRAISLVPA